MKKRIARFVLFFKSKRIIHSKNYQPAELIKRFESKGKKYVRVAFTNRIKYQGKLPITDIPYENVTMVRKLPSPFKKWLCRQIGIKAKGTKYIIKKDRV